MFKAIMRYRIKMLKCLTRQISWAKHCTNAFMEFPTYESAKKTLNQYWPQNDADCYIEEQNIGNVVYDCTVIIPAFNAEEHLAKCLDSISCQTTHYDVQVIAINDGSTDDTGNILNRYRDFPNWEVIHQANKGLSVSRNVGIARARGRYIMFVDADDFLTHMALENMLTVAFANDADLVVGGHQSMMPDSRTVINEKRYNTCRINPLGNVTGHAWAKLYSRRLFAHLRFPDGYWYEDSILAHIIFPLVENAYTISDIVYCHVINPRGIVNKTERNPRALESLYITELLLNEKKRFGLSHTLKDFEQFLHSVRLTYARTATCNPLVAKSIFSVQCELFAQFASVIDTKKVSDALVQALARRNFLAYLFAVWKSIWIY